MKEQPLSHVKVTMVIIVYIKVRSQPVPSYWLYMNTWNHTVWTLDRGDISLVNLDLIISKEMKQKYTVDVHVNINRKPYTYVQASLMIVR